ncbi:unnamed protein product, partial [Phaeothamnion confervicola]
LLLSKFSIRLSLALHSEAAPDAKRRAFLELRRQGSFLQEARHGQGLFRRRFFRRMPEAEDRLASGSKDAPVLPAPVARSRGAIPIPARRSPIPEARKSTAQLEQQECGDTRWMQAWCHDAESGGGSGGTGGGEGGAVGLSSGDNGCGGRIGDSKGGSGGRGGGGGGGCGSGFGGSDGSHGQQWAVEPDTAGLLPAFDPFGSGGTDGGVPAAFRADPSLSPCFGGEHAPAILLLPKEHERGRNYGVPALRPSLEAQLSHRMAAEREAATAVAQPPFATKP